MRILVTGGAGFIGSHVVEQFIVSGHYPIVLDDFSTGKDYNIPKGVPIYRRNIADDLSDIFFHERIDVVCHLAAATNVRKSVNDPLNDIYNNVHGMVNLLEYARKFNISRFVFSSTGGALYGNTDQLPTTLDHSTKPISPYGIDKLAGEQYLYYYNTVYGMPVTILRYSNVYGPRQDRKGEGGVVAVFIKNLLEGVTPVINGSGEQTRDFIYVEDIARVNVLAGEQNGNTLNTYNVSTGKECSVNKLFQVIAQKLDVSVHVHNGEALLGEILRSCLDNSVTQKELNWKPEVTLEDGINKTLIYFKEEYSKLTNIV